jgi:protein-S-isoprenylcysteine O-methyltransferase Ste14
MIKKLLHAMVRKFERKLGVTNEHMHYIVDASPGAFVDYMLFTKLATHRQSLPSDAMHLARIVSTQQRDCGSCVQVNVNLALRDGMRPEWINAALERRPEALPPELREIHEFVEHVLGHTYEEGELRESIRRRHGDAGLVDLACAVASAQVFPLTKQVLGFAKSCSKVRATVESAAGPAVERPSLVSRIVARLAVLAPVLAILALALLHSLVSRSPLVIAAQAAAVGLAIWARRSFAAGQFRVTAGAAPGGLIKIGPFRFIRHPMFTAALLFVWSAIIGHWSAASALIGLGLTLAIAIRIPVEERLVCARYPEYADYARATKRCIPFVL